MLIRMTDIYGNKVKIDPGTITQYWPVGLNVTGIEYESNGLIDTIIVNHDFQQITSIVCFNNVKID